MNDGAWTYTWAAGRQLKKMVREDRTLDFKYNHNGMRIQKVLQHDWYPETTNYTYHGKLLTHMTVDYHDWDEVAQQDKLHFFYDAQSRPVKISYNGVIYTYVHNLQGDIVGILDSTGALVVEYKYDAWGKLLSTTGSLADTLGMRNPFRYRGYVYDEESELYYLRSRYYNPLIGRFVNADVYIAVQTDISSHNLYSYCKNQCINCADTNGMFVFIITSGLEDALLSSEAQYEEISDAYGCNCVHAIVVGGVIPMTGTPNGYASGYNGSGELYEGWYDSDGNIIRVRHHSNHKNPKTHPKNPHDHRGKKDANGKPTIDHKGEDPDPNYKAPTADKNSNSAKTALAGVGVTGGSYLVYKVIKLIVGIIAAPSTGGASLIPAIAP